MNSRGTSAAWLVHPISLWSFAILVVNDHLLKTVWPGVVTGKLSDVAGLVVAPAVVAVATRAPARVALAVTLIGYVAAKATTAGAAAASALLTLLAGPSVVRADPTDLLALPALLLAGYAATRAAGRPLTRDRARRAAVLAGLPAVTLGLLASGQYTASAYRDGTAVTFTQWNGVVLLGVAAPGGDAPETWMASGDAGATFGDEAPPSAVASLRPAPSSVVTPDWNTAFEEARPGLPMAGGQACSPDDLRHCFRVVPGHLRVEETVDGGNDWATVWEVTDAQRRRLSANYARLGDVGTQLSSRAILVVDRPAGGYVVLVANGRDGMARRDPDGSWHRVAFTGATQPALPAASLDDAAGGRGPLAWTVGVGVLALGLWIPARRTGTTFLPFLAVALVGLAGWFDWAYARVMASTMPDDQLNRSFAFYTVTGLLVLAALVLWLTAWRRHSVRPAAFVPLLLCALAGGLGSVAFLLSGDLIGWPPSRVAYYWGGGAALVAVLSAVGLGRRYATRPRRRREKITAVRVPPRLRNS